MAGDVVSLTANFRDLATPGRRLRVAMTSPAPSAGNGSGLEKPRGRRASVTDGMLTVPPVPASNEGAEADTV